MIHYWAKVLVCADTQCSETRRPSFFAPQLCCSLVVSKAKQRSVLNTQRRRIAQGEIWNLHHSSLALLFFFLYTTISLQSASEPWSESLEMRMNSSLWLGLRATQFDFHFFARLYFSCWWTSHAVTLRWFTINHGELQSYWTSVLSVCSATHKIYEP